MIEKQFIDENKRLEIIKNHKLYHSFLKKKFITKSGYILFCEIMKLLIEMDE